ncbi:hypothetical protein [Aliarcobacter butzleri]|uniref:hypothetical protein n=1 Tax=Aliarcobacter butzleri TaxID=28197 RepID=UPI001ED9CB25|nr:hypothetical protein [Aliarcobacter butzleri]
MKIISSNLIIPINVDLDKEIEKFNITIKEITTEQLLEYKGINYKILKEWNEMPEIEKYKMAENTSDVNHYVQLFQMMGLKK